MKKTLAVILYLTAIYDTERESTVQTFEIHDKLDFP